MDSVKFHMVFLVTRLIVRNSDWFIALFTLVEIDRSNCVGFFEQLFEDLFNSAEKCLNAVHKTVTRVPTSHYQSGNRRVRVHDGMNSENYKPVLLSFQNGEPLTAWFCNPISPSWER